MTYNPAIPGPSDFISASQAEIQTNFSEVDTAFGIDHTPFSTLANQGLHKKVSLLAPITDPDQAGSIGTLYTKTAGTGTELFYQKGTAGAGVSQLTGGGVTAGAWVSINAAGAIQASFNIQMVSVTAGPANVYTITFSRSFNATSYLAVATYDISGVGGGTNVCSLDQQIKNVGSYEYRVRNAAGSFIRPTNTYILFFGVLA
jgi:hypothetical protein